MCLLDSIVGVEREDRETVYLTIENGRYVPAPPVVYVPGLKQIFDKLERQQWLRYHGYDSRRANSRRSTRAYFLSSHRSPAYMVQPAYWTDGPSSPKHSPHRLEEEPGMDGERGRATEALPVATGPVKKPSAAGMAQTEGALEHGGTGTHSPDEESITKPLKSILKNGSPSSDRSTPQRTRRKSVSFEDPEDAIPTDTKIANDKTPPSPPMQEKGSKKERKQARKEAKQSSKHGTRLKSNSGAPSSTAPKSSEQPAEKGNVVEEEEDVASDTDWELARRIKRLPHLQYANLFSSDP